MLLHAVLCKEAYIFFEMSTLTAALVLVISQLGLTPSSREYHSGSNSLRTQSHQTNVLMRTGGPPGSDRGPRGVKSGSNRVSKGFISPAQGL